MLGLTPNLRPKFVKRYAELYEAGVEATRAYCDEVKGGAFPAEEHSFGLGKSTKKPSTPRGAAIPNNVVAIAVGYGPTEA
jgi:3-methyl-2-oxobutanoate hydroxymethyltransferase